MTDANTGGEGVIAEGFSEDQRAVIPTFVEVQLDLVEDRFTELSINAADIEATLLRGDADTYASFAFGLSCTLSTSSRRRPSA